MQFIVVFEDQKVTFNCDTQEEAIQRYKENDFGFHDVVDNDTGIEDGLYYNEGGTLHPIDIDTDEII